MTAPFVKLLRSWTTTLRSVVPNWQQQRPGALVGAKFLYALILPIDITVENTLQGVNDWAPGSPNASPTALALLGQSRGLIQGEAETADQFAARLRGWRAVGKQAGKTEILAQQIQRYLGNNPLVRVVQRIANAKETRTTADFAQPAIGGSVAVALGTTANMLSPGFVTIDGWGTYEAAVIDPTHATLTNTSGAGDGTVPAGAVLTYATTGTPQGLYVTANTDGSTSVATSPWNWDAVLGWTDEARTYSGAQVRLFWSDTWIVVYPGEWSIAGSITPLTGQHVPAIAHDAILRLVGQWKGIHTFVRAIIFSYNAALFDPADPGHAGNPDGTWGNWSKDDGSGNQIPARNVVDARYWIPPQG